MKSFKVPFQEAEDEFVEKKSRFIGRIYKIETPERAAEIIKAMQKKYWDASHNVYAYVLENGVMRFSDDGEPQGTAGMPTLEVLKKEELCNVLCVTTRYFGGTLLGAGGLVRAYSKCAALAVAAAGIAMMQPFSEVLIECPYNILENVRKQLSAFEAQEQGADFGAAVTLTAFLPCEKLEAFTAHIIDKTNGAVIPMEVSKKLFAKKL